jgi:putative Holliday junction resolvase
LETIHRERPAKLRQTFARIESLLEEYQVEKIVLGLPKKMDNQEGKRCETTRAFGEQIERRTGLEVIYQDERLTTVAADAILDVGGVSKENRKTYIDKVAASLILQGYLDALHHQQG